MGSTSDCSRRSLYRAEYERDACGVGFVATLSGQPDHAILQTAVSALEALAHRGAIGGDTLTGDGAGILAQMPWRLFRREAEKLGHTIRHPRDLAVGMIFAPRQDRSAHELARRIVQETVQGNGLTVLGWRQVPINAEALGDRALRTCPQIEQILVARSSRMSDDDFARTLYLVRKVCEQRASEANLKDFYITSFSARTITYKALLSAPNLARFYLDLRDPDFRITFAIFHQRYSTNTFPSWFLAQPFRMLAHNGEINTIAGNRNWMRAREPELKAKVWGERIEALKPVIWSEGSDSASLDNVLELLVMSGRSLLHAMMMLVPEAHENMPDFDPKLRDFYEYHDCLMEPWDGPAALAFSDGRYVGACLDRNGLRPSRYMVTSDGLVVVASEVGVVRVDPEKVVEKGRLGPGKMIAVDVERGLILRDDQIKLRMAERKPYGKWVSKNMLRFSLHEPKGARPALDDKDRLRQQIAFGYTLEDVERLLRPMAKDAKESVGSMGDDTPLAYLSHRPRILYDYFKQRFAQVTNPPIDPLRETLVMSLSVHLGARKNLLSETPEHARLIKLSSPVLTWDELEWLRSFSDREFGAVTLPALFEAAQGEAGLKAALENLCVGAEDAIASGKSILILSDRGINESLAPIPMLLAVGAVHHHLIRRGLRMRASLVAETGDAREEHHLACLLGYGASAVCPYLAFESVLAAATDSEEGIDPDLALSNYKHALEHGILKIMSKMGIATLSSYQGAQIFEAIGLNQELIDRCFTGTPSRIGGVGFEAIANNVLRFHSSAFAQEPTELPDAGFYRFRRGGEYHAFNPDVFRALHRAARSGDSASYREYAQAVELRPPMTVRDLLELKRGDPVPIDEVEPIESIVRRFSTSGMSHGALSREAHETLAIGMNRLGAKSNSGEGGEDRSRYRRRPNGDWPNSAIKQVASARFGVTPEYLVSASELEIKMAQGSKPGEGGQLPGHKVSPEIAAIRHSVPGVTLISPPPHHDIYSIEDLAQLIYDLKQINPEARVAVKLVAEAGVGTIAAGVAKAHADVVHISGHDGGTGASPLSSIKNAGVPWELGLAETHQILVMNDLRHRVLLRVDGGMKTGRDVVIAALLGADEYGFGSAALVAIGCVMARQCHLNTCPVGVATQDEKLRAKFKGKPEMVEAFFRGVAQQVREILAELGFRSLNEIIGRTDLLVPKENLSLPQPAQINLEELLEPVPYRPPSGRPLNQVDKGETLNDIILRHCAEALESGRPVKLKFKIANTDRTVGAKLAGQIARLYGDEGLPPGTIDIRFEGSAGQSFGAFCIEGMRLTLVGEANDYVGKGMAGGEIIIRPPEGSSFAWDKNVIIGNTVLYGATGGRLFAAGRAGERFAVRNSGAIAVVEGVGDHGCEYMTRGIVVVLGETGRNFGAGMTGGTAYVLDEREDFSQRYNPQLVDLERISDKGAAQELRALIAEHYKLTASPKAASILQQWDKHLRLFWRVVPRPYEARGVRKPEVAVGPHAQPPAVSSSVKATLSRVADVRAMARIVSLHARRIFP